MKTPERVGGPSRLVAHALPTRLRAVFGSYAPGSSCSQRPKYFQGAKVLEHEYWNLV